MTPSLLPLVLSLAVLGRVVSGERFTTFEDRQLPQTSRAMDNSGVDEYPLLARIQGTEYVMTPDVIFPRRQLPWPAMMASKRSALGVDLPEYMMHYKNGNSDLISALKERMRISGRR